MLHKWISRKGQEWIYTVLDIQEVLEGLFKLDSQEVLGYLPDLDCQELLEGLPELDGQEVPEGLPEPADVDVSPIRTAAAGGEPSAGTGGAGWGAAHCLLLPGGD